MSSGCSNGNIIYHKLFEVKSFVVFPNWLVTMKVKQLVWLCKTTTVQPCHYKCILLNYSQVLQPQNFSISNSLQYMVSNPTMLIKQNAEARMPYRRKISREGLGVKPYQIYSWCPLVLCMLVYEWIVRQTLVGYFYGLIWNHEFHISFIQQNLPSIR